MIDCMINSSLSTSATVNEKYLGLTSFLQAKLVIILVTGIISVIKNGLKDLSY